MNERFFSLVLHSHIPYVLDHGSWPHGMDWIYEAAAESYLPVLRAFGRLADEGVPAGANISFTPVVAAQLKDPGFVRGFDEYLRMKVEIARADHEWFERTGNPSLPLTVFWQEWYAGLLRDFHERFDEDIIASFRALEDRGVLEILTSAATHGYLPLLGRDESVRHQVLQGRHVHRRLFGREPRGFWIPECAYRPGYDWKPPFGEAEARTRPGVDEILAESGLGYFFVDAHLLRGGETLGVYADRFPGLKALWETSRKEGPASTGGAGADPYAGHLAHPSRLPFFARDEATGSQVWSRHMGYPGDGAYLEFHKKHYPGGLRFWRITGPGADLALKERYDPDAAGERVEVHAAHFVSCVESALASRESGVVTALYDTELFGHWWHEGPDWLYATMRRLAASGVRPLTASACLERLPPRSVVALPEGSWGQGGFHWVWLNEDTEWIWKRIYEIEEEARAVEALPGPDPRLLRQFYREKFLLESSDWPFLISTGTARDYAEGRAAEHFSRAAELARWLKTGRPLGPTEETTLRLYETEDGLFEEMVDPHGTPIQ